MSWLILTLLSVTTGVKLPKHSHHSGLRVIDGIPDIHGEFNFVVCLVTETKRLCSGSLITSDWVLTAGHCLYTDISNATHIQYGNMSVLPRYSTTKSKIIKSIIYPGYRDSDLLNDIGLLRVEPVHMKVYGRLLAVDYLSLVGFAVQYAGYGFQSETLNTNKQPLMIGEGVLIPCDENYHGPVLCVAPKCSNPAGDSASGDSGGPVMLDHKIIGVVTGGIQPIGVYTQISPFLMWIYKVVHTNKLDDT